MERCVTIAVGSARDVDTCNNALDAPAQTRCPQSPRCPRCPQCPECWDCPAYMGCLLVCGIVWFLVLLCFYLLTPEEEDKGS